MNIKQEPVTKEQKMKNKIMHKAFTLMAKKGIETVSMREIASSCSVTKPVLYYYFKNKEDLCRSIIGSSMADFHEKLFDESNKDITFKDLCRKAFELHLEYFKKDPKRVMFLIHVMSYAAKGGKKGGQTFMDVKCERKAQAEKVFKSFETKGDMPKGSCKDAVHMFSAVIMHFMMNTLTGFGFEFDNGLPARMSEIIYLGIKDFYKGKEK